MKQKHLKITTKTMFYKIYNYICKFLYYPKIKTSKAVIVCAYPHCTETVFITPFYTKLLSEIFCDKHNIC